MHLREKLQATLGDAYTVERELGGGGMSRVFVAEEKSLGRKVVVKALSGDLGSSLSAERFAREVKVAASLHHPNIVPVLATGSADGVPYYTMPFVKGDSLRARLNEPTPLPRRQALSVLRDIARALQFAHDEGVIHRDIKPDNVLLAGDAAVVTDFGIAKAISAARTTDVEARSSDTGLTLTLAGVSVGTPAYMAPEQISGDALDHRVDLYAWGVVAYEALSGEHPFPGQHTAQRYLVAHLSHTPVDIRERVPDLPDDIAALVHQCLQKNPAGRPASANEILERLEDARTSNETRTMRAMRTRRAKPHLIVGGIAIAGAFAAALFLYQTRADRATAPAATRSSVAVLPFAQDRSDSANMYFAEGIADELISALAKVPGLRVASRTSAFALAAREDLDVREIGRNLGVAAVVEGTVRRAGNRLRVTAHLTSTSDGLTLWSDTYERESKDVFAVQDDIARAVVATLKPAGASAGTSQPGVKMDVGTTDPDAYDLYLRGLYLLERRGVGVVRAAEYFTQARERDPQFARAHAGLASALSFYPYFAGVSAARLEKRITDAANRALALDSSLAEPRVALAMAHTHAFRWNEAEAEFRRALRADSLSSVAHTQFGRFLLVVGQLPESMEHFRKARVLDPLAGTPSVWLSHTLALSGRAREAAAEARRARELDPNLVTVQTVLAIDRFMAGDIQEARSMTSGPPARLPFNAMTAYVLQRLGDTARAASIRRELETLPDTAWMVHTGRVFAYLGVGDTARVLNEADAALRAREILPNWLSFFNPIFDPIRRSERFALIVRAYGLNPEVFARPMGGRPSE